MENSGSDAFASYIYKKKQKKKKQEKYGRIKKNTNTRLSKKKHKTLKHFEWTILVRMHFSLTFFLN